MTGVAEQRGTTRLSAFTVSSLTLRKANASDWSQIWPIWKAIVAAGETHPYPTGSAEQDAIALWLKPAGSAIYVAEQDNTIVAAMMTKPLRYGNGDHIANFDLMVKPALWGRGIGQRLASYVIDETRRAGYLAMETYAVVETNVRSVRLWERFGFSTIAVVPGAFRHPVHGLVGVHHMYKSLT